MLRRRNTQYAADMSVPHDSRPPFLDFFAGSGLVSHALQPYFREVWANDICPKKAAVFHANHPGAPFCLRSITDVHGSELPACILSWASFPCQDLSLAGAGKGIRGKRSGLVWEWLRVMDEMAQRPPILAIENVLGLISADKGIHYRELHLALEERGYQTGAMLLDAVRWLPHSRPRVFVVAADKRVSLPQNLVDDAPNWAHPAAIRNIAAGLSHWIWWRLPEPERQTVKLSEIVDYSLPCQDEVTSKKNLDMVPSAHRSLLEQCGFAALLF